MTNLVETETIQFVKTGYLETIESQRNPIAILGNGEIIELKDDIPIILPPDAFIMGDYTGPCRILMLSAVRENPEFINGIEQLIVYMHATPGSLDLEDPRTGNGLQQKYNLIWTTGEELKNYGYSPTRVLTFTQAKGYVGELFQENYASNIGSTWRPPQHNCRSRP